MVQTLEIKRFAFGFSIGNIGTRAQEDCVVVIGAAS